MKYLPLAALALLLTACDSTPRERQEMARKELKNLDTLARTGGQRLARAAKKTAAYDAANRARRAQPLDARHQQQVSAQLLGPFAGNLARLTPETIAGAYGQLLRETRARHAAWTLRDWDYARATYRALNAELQRLRLDLPAREELRVRARQAEFVALQATRTADDLGSAVKEKQR